MSARLLIYGATGFTGALMADAAARMGLTGVVLAGRRSDLLRPLAEAHGFDFTTFALDEPRAARAAVRGSTVVLNCAGPFAFTAERLAKAALAEGCHYVDIGGEIDVYRRLDDLAPLARQRGVAMVAGAGFTPAVSSWMLARALLGPLQHTPPIGAVRIAHSAPQVLSRGSAEVVWRSMREQVLVVRPTVQGHPQRSAVAFVQQGLLRRRFQFGPRQPRDAADHLRGNGDALRPADATAVSLIDTLTAQRALARADCAVSRIESYVEAGAWRQLAFDAGAWLSPFASIAPLRAGLRLVLPLLPDGPNAPERQRLRQSVVLQVEDMQQRMLVDWCVQTPDLYVATATLALTVADSLRTRSDAPAGWLTPGEILRDWVDIPAIGLSAGQGMGQSASEGAQALESVNRTRAAVPQAKRRHALVAKTTNRHLASLWRGFEFDGRAGDAMRPAS